MRNNNINFNFKTKSFLEKFKKSFHNQSPFLYILWSEILLGSFKENIAQNSEITTPEFHQERDMGDYGEIIFILEL